MGGENISHEKKKKNIDDTRNYFVEEIDQNEFLCKKHKKVCATLNYIDHVLILASVVTICISISAFTSLVSITIVMTSSAVGLKICAITAATKSISQ